MEPELILDSRVLLAEGPAWSSAEQRLYWVDILAGDLHVYDPLAGTDITYHTGEPLGCVAPRRGGGLVLGLKTGFALLDSLPASPAAPLELRRLPNPEPNLPGNRFNDGKCDPSGRFLAGSMDNAEVEACGTLYSLSPDCQVTPLLSGLRISNGMAWSPDHSTFYFIDTPTRLVMAYDYDLAAGSLSNPRPVISVPSGMGYPDGMTSDRQGMLWIALWGGAALTRWDPSTGRLLEKIDLPALNVSACAFGGVDLRDLYITTARKSMDAGQIEQYPHSGSLFRLRTDVVGMPTFEFGG